MRLYFLTADLKRLRLFLFVELRPRHILFRGYAHHRTQGRDNGRIVHLVVAADALGIFKTLQSLNDDELTFIYLLTGRVEIIDLAFTFKFYTNNFCQFCSSFLMLDELGH